jgi:hypothetical protein
VPLPFSFSFNHPAAVSPAGVSTGII